MASLSDVVTVLQNQTEEIKDTNQGVNNLIAVIQKQMDAQKRQAGDELEDKIRQRRASKTAPSQPTTFKGGIVGAIKQDMGIGFIQKLASWSFGALGGALGAVGVGGAIAGLTPALGKMIGRAFTRGPLAAAILLFGETALTKMFESLDPNDITTDEFKSSVASSLSNAATLGVLGSILGRRLGAALFVGSLIGDGIKSLFDDETLKSKFLEGFGLNVNFEDFITYGSIIASFFGPALIGSALRGALGLGAAAGPAGAALASGAAAKSFKDGFKPGKFNVKGLGVRLGWAGLIGFTGGILAEYIGDQTQSQTAEDLVNIGTGVATIAALFGTGPAGVLAATAYFAYKAGKKIIDYSRERQERLDAEFDAKVQEYERFFGEVKTGVYGGYSPISERGRGSVGDQAVEIAEFSGIQASGFNPAEYSMAQAAKEEAMLSYLEKTGNIKALELAYAAEEYAFQLKTAQGTMTNNNIFSSGNAAALVAAAIALKELTGKENEITKAQKKYIADPQGYVDEFSGVPIPPGNTFQPEDFLLPDKPVRDDFTAWWKSYRRETYDFKEAMKEYNSFIEGLIAPELRTYSLNPFDGMNQYNIKQGDTYNQNNQQGLVIPQEPTASDTTGGNFVIIGH